MTIDDYQIRVADVVTRYGRPPTSAAHMRKLGEEVGELAEAVANNDIVGIANEVADIINVVTSLLDQRQITLGVALKYKLAELESRIVDGKRDRRYGKQDEIGRACKV